MERTPTPRPMTVDQYYAQAFEPDARVELVEGEVVEMPPIGSPHGSTVALLDHLLHRAATDRVCVRCQLPVRLSTISEPVPDIAVVKSRADRYRTSHPTAADALLIIEVSASTLRYDIDVKIPLYARHGIPEIWIVDLNNRLFRTYRSPSDGRYREAASTANPGTVSVPGIPCVAVDLSELLTP